MKTHYKHICIIQSLTHCLQSSPVILVCSYKIILASLWCHQSTSQASLVTYRCKRACQRGSPPTWSPCSPAPGRCHCTASAVGRGWAFHPPTVDWAGLRNTHGWNDLLPAPLTHTVQWFCRKHECHVASKLGQCRAFCVCVCVCVCASFHKVDTNVHTVLIYSPLLHWRHSHWSVPIWVLSESPADLQHHANDNHNIVTVLKWLYPSDTSLSCQIDNIAVRHHSTLFVFASVH